MSSIDVEKLLEAISPESPCGDDLEYDDAFGEMERAGAGRPEQQIGDVVSEGEEPDWKAVRQLALDLFSRTKDLRVSVYLTRAISQTDGFVGLRDGLQLVKGLIDEHWEGVHPRLDPEDDNDPTIRVNTIATLCDADTMLRSLRQAPLVSSRALGIFSMRDIDIASGAVAAPSEDEPGPDMTAIDAAFMDAELETLQATAEAVTQSIECASSIEVVLTEKVGTSHAVDLSALPTLLREIQPILSDHLARRGVLDATEVDAAAEGGAGAAAAAPVTGDVTSREDVIRVLDKACDYFARYEPSSPVPLLLHRAKRLVSKNFIEALRDLAPSGLSEAQAVGGIDAEESQS